MRQAALPDARLRGERAAAASDRLIAAARRELGRLDALVIRAMPRRRASARTASLRAWQVLLDGSLRAAFFTARAAGLTMQAAGQGAIVFVIDQAADDDASAVVVREGLMCLADGLARALAPAHVAQVVIDGRPRAIAAVSDEAIAGAIRAVLARADGAAVGVVRLRPPRSRLPSG
ncbi:MAG: SDR family NAD(P)-dependent oxidoreductase [Candidatus Binatia bacterium]